MLDDVIAMPLQLGDALWRAQSAGISAGDSSAGLVVCGMGGSAIGGDLAVGALGDRATRPISVVRGYAIEGHVPADVIRKLLKEKPAGIAGIAVPGMPAGSPGMEGLYKDKYNVVAFGKDGSQTVYAER